MSPNRILVLLRHAKSAYPGAVRDHDRPLGDRGRREGALAGDWLRAEIRPIDEVLCSTALRTRQTVEVAGLSAPLRLSPAIYEATPDDILAEIALTADDVHTLVVVGHGPGLPGLAMELAGEESDPEALAELQTRFPTAAIAVLEVEGAWADLSIGEARLSHFHIARA